MIVSEKEQEIINRIMALRLLDEKSSIIDIGCRYSDCLGQYLHNEIKCITPLTLIDKEPAIPEPTIIKVDVREYVKKQPKFDVVICKNVIHFAKSLREYYEMYQACYGLLKDGGIMYLQVVNESHIPSGKIKISDNRLVELIGNGIQEINHMQGNTEVYILKD